MSVSKTISNNLFNSPSFGLGIKEQSKFILSTLYNKGGLNYSTISSFNNLPAQLLKFLQDNFFLEIDSKQNMTNVPNPNGKGTIDTQVTIELSLYIKDLTISKPARGGSKPIYPIDCVRMKEKYVGRIEVMYYLHIKASVGEGEEKKEVDSWGLEFTLDIGNIPVMVGSTLCNTNPAETGAYLSPRDYMDNFMKSISRPGSLPDLDQGLLILNGIYSSVVCDKDMRRNELFYNVDSTTPLKVAVNILCDNPKSNSINVIFRVEKRDNGIGSIRIEVKNPPFNIYDFHFIEVFQWFEVFDHYEIIKGVLSFVGSEHRNIVKSFLVNAMDEYFDMKYKSSIHQVIPELISRMNDKNKLDDYLEKIDPVKLSDTAKFEILRERIFVHVDKNKGTECVRFLCQCLADIIIKCKTQIEDNDLGLVRGRIAKEKTSPVVTKIHVPIDTIKGTLRPAYYKGIQRPLFYSLKAAISKATTLDVLRQIIDISYIRKTIKDAMFSQNMCTAEVKRQNISGEVLVDTKYKAIATSRNSIGINNQVRCHKTAKQYAGTEACNASARQIAGDNIGFIDPLNMSEREPGKNMVFSITTQISEVMDIDAVYAKVMKSKLICDDSCRRPHHSVIRLNGRNIGRTHQEIEYRDFLMDLRKNGEVPYLLGVYVNIKEKKILIKALEGILGQILIRVKNNMQEYIKSRGQIEFKQWIALTPQDVDDYIHDRVTEAELIKQDKMMWITNVEIEQYLTCPSIEELEEKKNDISTQYHYCWVPLQIFSPPLLNIPGLSKSEPIRPTYATCQGTHTSEAYCATMLALRKTPKLLNGHKRLYEGINTYMNGIDTETVFCCYGTMPEAQEEGAIANSHWVSRNGLGCITVDEISCVLDSGSSLITNLKGRDDVPSYIDQNTGLPRPGTKLKPGDILFFVRIKQHQVDTEKLYDTSINKYRLPIKSVVRYAYATTSKQNTAKIVIRIEIRLPAITGSKGAHINGSKFVITNLLNPYEMPRTLCGMTPSMLCSPSTSPKRGIYQYDINKEKFDAVDKGYSLVYPMFIQPLPNDVPKDIQEKLSCDEEGLFKAYSFTTGYAFKNPLQMTFTETKRVSNHGKLSEFSNGLTQKDPLTMRPRAGGRRENGNFKLGEMEKRALYATGNSSLLSGCNEDTILDVVCRCGSSTPIRQGAGVFCRKCGANDPIYFSSTYAAKTVQTLCAGAHIDLKYRMKRVVPDEEDIVDA